MRLLFIILCLLASATSFARWPSMQAKWIERDYEKQIGVLEYLDQGANSVVEERRLDSKEKMNEFCGAKKYKIVKEVSGTKEYGGRSGGVTTVAVSDRRHIIVIKIGTEQTEVPVQMNYNYIAFKCSK